MESKKLKFIHTSDWHIDNSFSQFSDFSKKEELRKSRWRIIEKLFNYAKNNNISLILVGGDQFDDGFSVSKEAFLKLLNLIEKYNSITFIMIAGNHDPYTDGSIYKKVEKSLYPTNLKFITDKEEIYLENINCKIFSASLTSKNGRHNPLDWIPNEQDDCFRIGLSHGSLKIEGKYNVNDFPIDLDFAEKKGLSYLALGHYHSFYQQGDRTFYSGTIEQMQPHDTFYVLDVELEKGKNPFIKKIELNNYEWQKKEIEVSDININSVLDELKKYGKNTIVELSLKGYLSFEDYKQTHEKLQMLNTFYSFIEDQIKINPSDEEIRNLNIEGYLENIIETIENSDSEIQKEIEKYSQEVLKQIENPNIKFQQDMLTKDEIKIKIIDLALLKIYDFFKEKGE